MGNDLVSDLDEPGRVRLSKIMQNRHYQKSQAIFSSGTIPRDLVILNEGTAELAADERAEHCRQALHGEVFGLTEIISDTKYDDTLTAISDCEISVIDREDLIRYLRTTPEACYRSLEVLAASLHKARERLVGGD